MSRQAKIFYQSKIEIAIANDRNMVLKVNVILFLMFRNDLCYTPYFGANVIGNIPKPILKT